MVWANSTANVHTFLTFVTEDLVSRLKADPADPRASPLDFVWGASSWAIETILAANPETRISKYIPCCRDTQVQVYGPAAIQNYTQRGWADRVLYKCDRKTPAYYDNGAPGRPSHLSLPIDFSNPDVVAWQAEQFGQPAAAAGYDVLALDNTILENAWGACGVWRTPTKWVQLYNGSSLDAAFQSAVVGWLGALKAKINALTTRRGEPMRIIPNFALHQFKWNDDAILGVGNATDGILSESGFIGGGWRGPGQPYDYLGDAWAQRVRFALNLQKAGKAYYSINAYGDHTNHSQHCDTDPHACITSAVRQWVLASYLMGKQQASGIALYQLLAPLGSEHGYGNWSAWPEWSAAVGAPVGDPEESAAGLWSRHYSRGFVLVNPWPDRGTLNATLPPPPAGEAWVDLYGKEQPAELLQLQPVTATILILVLK